MNATADAFMGIFGFKRVKQKTCKSCKKKFTPSKPLQSVCSPDCAISLIKAESAKKTIQAAKESRKKDRERKELLKSRADWAREAQASVNAYVRERDKDHPCISCGRHHSGQYHAGHYLSRGAHPELSLDPLNIHKQCQPCNTHLSGNQINFRKGLIAKIGLEKVEWLESHHEPKKHTIDELKAIKDFFKAQLKALKGKS